MLVIVEYFGRGQPIGVQGSMWNVWIVKNFGCFNVQSILRGSVKLQAKCLHAIIDLFILVVVKYTTSIEIVTHIVKQGFRVRREELQVTQASI